MRLKFGPPTPSLLLLPLLGVILIAMTAGCGGTAPRDRGEPALSGPSPDPPPRVVLRDPQRPSLTARQVYFDPDDTLVPLTPEVLEKLDPDYRFSLGLDRLVRQEFRSLNHKRIAVVTSRLAIDSEGTHLLDSLLPTEKPIVSRVIIFGDELPYPTRSRAITRIVGSYPAVRVFERNHRAFRLTSAMLDDAELVLIDLPIRPATSYPEVGFFAQVLEQASLRGLPVLVLDRPNPMGGVITEGPPGSDDLYGGISSHFPDLLVHGMSTGELARFYDQQFGLNLDLEVLELLHWRRTAGCAQLIETHERLGIDPTQALPDWAIYCPPDMRTSQLQLIADLLPEGRATVESEGLELPRLLVDTSPQEPEAFVEALARFQIAEFQPEATGGGEVALTARNLLQEPIFASVALWSVLASGDASLLPEQGDPGKYGTGVVMEGLRAGRDPREIRRLWNNDPAMNDLEVRRARLLR